MASGAGSASVHVVLYDAGCALCDAAVRFVIEHDRAGCFRFAALRSEAGSRLLFERGHVAVGDQAGSVLLVQGAEVYARTDAVLRIARRLDGPWSLLHGLVVVPRIFRDPLYRLVARHRHRWFGRSGRCLVPDPEHATRFLS